MFFFHRTGLPTKQPAMNLIWQQLKQSPKGLRSGCVLYLRCSQPDHVECSGIICTLLRAPLVVRGPYLLTDAPLEELEDSEDRSLKAKGPENRLRTSRPRPPKLSIFHSPSPSRQHLSCL